MKRNLKETWLIGNRIGKLGNSENVEVGVLKLRTFKRSLDKELGAREMF